MKEVFKMKKLTYILLFALVLTTALFSACGNADRNDHGTDISADTADTRPVEDEPPVDDTKSADVTNTDDGNTAGGVIVIDDGEELCYNVSGVKLIEDGYVYRECWMTSGEINAVLDILSEIDISRYDTVDWKTEDIPAEGYWLVFIIITGDEVHRVNPHWCLSIDGVGYKWEYDENFDALYSLAEQIRDNHDDWGDVTEPN